MYMNTRDYSTSYLDINLSKETTFLLCLHFTVTVGSSTMSKTDNIKWM